MKRAINKILLASACLLAACSGANAAEIKVVASVLPVWVFAKNVAGDRIDIALLIKGGADPHSFVLRPSDAKALDEADLVLVNGAGLEKNLLRGIDPKKVFDTSDGVEKIMLGRTPDPHVWLDPLRAQRQVENIAQALASVDPDGKDVYLMNAAAYIKRLAALHKDIAGAISKIGAKRLITYHESFNYFAGRYGMKSLSLTGPDAETPLPGHMREVYDIVGKEGVMAIFEEVQFRPGLLGKLAGDLGARVCTLDSMVSGEPSADMYEKTMRRNIKTMTECLGGK